MIEEPPSSAKRTANEALEGGPTPKRVRREDDAVVILDLLACVGDKSSGPDSVKNQISGVVDALAERLGDDQSRELFEGIGVALVRCGLELPYKASTYGTIVGLLASRLEEERGTTLSRRLAKAVCNELSSCLRDGRSLRARRALRYLSELSKARVITAASLVSILCSVSEAAVTELTETSRGVNNVHARGEFLASIVLSTMPWCGSCLAADAPERLAELAEHLQKIKEIWVPNRWRAVALGHGKLASETFGEMLLVVDDLRRRGWQVNSDLLPNMQALFEEALAKAPHVELDPFQLPAHSKKTRYAPPRFRLCLLSKPEEASEDAAQGADGDAHGSSQVKTEEEVENKMKDESDQEDGAEKDNKATTEEDHTKENDMDSPGSGPSLVERFVLRQYVVDVLDNFAVDHWRSAERLLSVQMLADANDVIVETVFSEMCAMPVPAHVSVYYGTVFVDLCTVKDSRLPVKLLAAVEKMFNDARYLDPESFDRLTEWFAYHLSNFGFKWNWAEWAVYADTEMVTRFPFRALFCRNVLDRIVRLSYLDRIKKLVPEDLHMFLPSPASGNREHFDMTVTDEIVGIIAGKGKQPPEVVTRRLEELFPLDKFDNDEETATCARLVCLIRAVLHGSARTLSHLDTLVERYIGVLRTLSTQGGIRARRAVAAEAGTYWSSSNFRTLYTLDKLARFEIIDGMTIIDYVLSLERYQRGSGDDGGELPMDVCSRLEDSAVWELVRLVFLRSRSRLEGARKEVTAAASAAAGASEGDAEEVENRLKNAKEWATKAKVDLQQQTLLALRRLFELSDWALSAQAAARNGAANDDDAEQDNDQSAKMDTGTNKFGEVFLWRAIGMMREICRKHAEQIEAVLEDITSSTAECRERHEELQEAYEVVQEISGCDIHASIY